MPSLLQTTINSMLIRAAANLTAQLSQPRPNGIDYFRIFQFMIFGLTSAPINTQWQRFLESHFPTQKPGSNKIQQEKSEKGRDTTRPGSRNETSLSGISWVNIILKVLLDQTIGLPLLNVMFLIIMNIEQFNKPQLLIGIVQQRLFPILTAAWRIWPIVALTNFVFVPVESRVLLISCVAFGWTVFLSFFEGK